MKLSHLLTVLTLLPLSCMAESPMTPSDVVVRFFEDGYTNGQVLAQATHVKPIKPLNDANWTKDSWKNTTKDDIPQVFYKHYPAYKSGQLNTSEFARVCDMSRTTIYKYVSLLEN